MQPAQNHQSYVTHASSKMKPVCPQILPLLCMSVTSSAESYANYEKFRPISGNVASRGQPETQRIHKRQAPSDRNVQCNQVLYCRELKI